PALRGPEGFDDPPACRAMFLPDCPNRLAPQFISQKGAALYHTWGGPTLYCETPSAMLEATGGFSGDTLDEFSRCLTEWHSPVIQSENFPRDLMGHVARPSLLGIRRDHAYRPLELPVHNKLHCHRCAGSAASTNPNSRC